jgi:hypothetical protein
MNAIGTITMTMRELDRFKVIQDVADGKLKPWRAAERLELTTRQVRRLVARLREHGPAGLVSGHRAKPGNRRLDPGAADRALSIIRDRYADFGPTLVGSAPTASTEGLSTSSTTSMPGRADPDRRQRSSVVRGTGAGLHAAGVCG